MVSEYPPYMKTFVKFQPQVVDSPTETALLKVRPTITTTESFTTLNSKRPDLVSTVRIGLASVAPKKRIPATVVNQSKRPTAIIAEEKTSSFLTT